MNIGGPTFKVGQTSSWGKKTHKQKKNVTVVQYN